MMIRKTLLLLTFCLPMAASTVLAQSIAETPNQVRPLLLGSSLPQANLRTLEGDAITLKDAVGGQPALLVFYRGGWCPYCNLQLQGLRLIRDKLDALGYRMIAISPDSPESMRATLDKTPIEYTLLSDSKAEAITAFGLAFRVDDDTLTKYQGYGIDLEKAAGGESHHALPVPAVYLVDAEGTLQFSYVHPDYTVRMPESVGVMA
jgi:peroxiredoxin